MLVVYLTLKFKPTKLKPWKFGRKSDSDSIVIFRQMSRFTGRTLVRTCQLFGLNTRGWLLDADTPVCFLQAPPA